MGSIIFDTKGGVRFIHDDSLMALVKDSVDDVVIRRASYVEPTDDGLWEADMSPVYGPVLGPFDTRGEALSEEVAWLAERMIPVPKETK